MLLRGIYIYIDIRKQFWLKPHFARTSPPGRPLRTGCLHEGGKELREEQVKDRELMKAGEGKEKLLEEEMTVVKEKLASHEAREAEKSEEWRVRKDTTERRGERCGQHRLYLCGAGR